jgi:hypothetical protein
MKAKRLWAGLLISALVALQAATVTAQGNPEVSKSHKITGSWMVTVSPQGAPTSFQGLITFTEGGAVLASAQGDVLLNAPPGVAAVATAGHGAWAKTGPHEYSFTFRQIFYDSDGNFQGGAKVRGIATINADGDSWSGPLRGEWFDAAGDVTFDGAGTQLATRIKVEPLTP